MFPLYFPMLRKVLRSLFYDCILGHIHDNAQLIFMGVMKIVIIML